MYRGGRGPGPERGGELRAARFHAAGDVRVEEVAEPPRDPAPGTALIRVLACGICGSDLHEYRDGPHFVSPAPHPLTGTRIPQILGHELAGVVVAIGPGVTAVARGDRVSVMPAISCRKCRPCRTGAAHLCEIGGAVGMSWPWGGFAELAAVPASCLTPLPDEVSDAAGALVEPTAVAVHAVDSAAVGDGDLALVTGAGPIGLLVALAARAAGARVLVSEPGAGRRAQAAALGLSVHDPAEGSPSEALAALWADRADVCFECAGAAAALGACVEATRRGGTIVQIGIHPGPALVDVNALVGKGVTLRGLIAYPLDSWPRVIESIASGRIPVDELVSATIDLDEIVENGFQPLLRSPEGAVKIVVRP